MTDSPEGMSTFLSEWVDIQENYNSILHITKSIWWISTNAKGLKQMKSLLARRQVYPEIIDSQYLIQPNSYMKYA